MIGHYLAKLYGSILESELSIWAKRNGCCSVGQVGFQKGFKTLDHISTLQALIEENCHSIFYCFTACITIRNRIEEIKAKVSARKNWFDQPIHVVAQLLHSLRSTDTSDTLSPELHLGWVSYSSHIFDEDHQLYDDLLQLSRRIGGFNNPMPESLSTMETQPSW